MYRLVLRAPTGGDTYSFQVVQPTVEVNALTLGSPVTGAIDTAGDIDEWQFEGLLTERVEAALLPATNE